MWMWQPSIAPKAPKKSLWLANLANPSLTAFLASSVDGSLYWLCGAGGTQVQYLSYWAEDCGLGYRECITDNSVGGTASQPEDKYQHLYGLPPAMVSILMKHAQECIQTCAVESGDGTGVSSLVGMFSQGRYPHWLSQPVFIWAFDFQVPFPTAGAHNFPIWRCA